MVAHVEGMLNTSDALQIATCFGFNVRDIEETEKQGSRYVMKLLRDKGKFDFRNVTLFREALKQLDLIQAANRVGLYEDHLKLPGKLLYNTFCNKFTIVGSHFETN